MTGSTRLSSSTANSVRAPYAAPQATVSSPSAPSGSVAGLAPFVPREFRASVRNDVTAVPAAERSANVDAFAARTPLSSVIVTRIATPDAPISELFGDDAASTANFAAFIESHDAETASGDVELPWIDAFAADVPGPEPEETWPLGEAGKRLNELTESLSSLDASRERIQAEQQNADASASGTPEAPLPMWNEEEWIDIMPTSPSYADSSVADSSVANTPVADSAVENSSVVNSSVGESSEAAVPSAAIPATGVNAESAARALEGLAQRVRAGEVKVPAFPNEIAQEAVLAGLLASMLGWRQ